MDHLPFSSARKQQALEARARRAAERVGLIAHKSRRQISLDNFGGFLLVDADRNFVVAGSRYDMSAEGVVAQLGTVSRGRSTVWRIDS